MLTLGFSNQFYTLWEVGEPYKKYGAGCVINGVFTGDFTLVQACTYIQNLSLDYDAAIAKIAEKSAGQFRVDLGLRGTSSFARSCGTGNDTPDYIFTFGQLAGQDIRICDNVWQLKRAVTEERGKRRRVYARRRLIELGELVRNSMGAEAGKESWITPGHLKYVSDRLDKRSKSGHFFENGNRIELSIKRIGGVSWPSQYGTVYVEEYITEDGKVVKYKGSSPLDIEDDFVHISATIEHIEYKGQPETRLKRPKILCH